MIEAWKWDETEPNSKSGAPHWVIEAYEKGKIYTLFERKLGMKFIFVDTKYGMMRGCIGDYILQLDYKTLIILTSEDRKILSNVQS